MKILMPFAFLLLAPLAFGQDTATRQPVPVKVQEQASKSAPKIDPVKEAAIRKLFEVQGTKKSMEQVIAEMSANMKPTLSKMLPPGEYQDKLIPLFFEKFQSKLKTDDLLDLIVPIYDKHFSKEDIDGLAQFYQTPLGKKMASVLPQVLVESQSGAMKMGQELGRKAMLEVLAEHPELEKAMEDAAARKN